MKEIKLTQGKIALVDDEDFEKLNRHKWYAFKEKNTFYAARRTSQANGQKRKIIKMHNEILGYPPPGFIMHDHKDGNGLNNQKYNLRFVTNRQNCQNRTNCSGTSKYPGVDWRKTYRIWRARIWAKGKSISLGCFQNEIDAFNAYKKAVEMIGEKIVGD